jgi:serine/threonine protein phosphatase PrpC
MTTASPSASVTVEWGVGARALGGSTDCGDLHVVAPFPDGVLVGVIDGLGHGGEAAEAARLACEVLTRHAGDTLTRLVDRCHAELRRTRGVVLSLAAVDGASRMLTWLGIGNVEGVLFRAAHAADPRRETIVLRGGVVGYQLPGLRETTLSLASGDMLVFATDGIRSGFGDESPIGRDPQEVADDLVARFGRETDDALVLVARCRWAAP